MSHLSAAPRPRWSRTSFGVLVLAAMFGLALVGAPRAFGVTRTWTGLGPTNNWSDALNWSGGVPGAADVASFDGTSSKNATINAAPASVLGLTVAAGYTGTISQGAGIALTVGATGYSQASGSFVGSAAAITVNGPFTISGGTFSSTSGTLSIAGNYTHTGGGSFAPNGGAVALITGAATIDVASSETFTDLRFTAGVKTVAAGDTLNVAGALTLTAGSINTGTVAAQGSISQALGYGGGTGTLLINGAAAQTLTGASTTASGNLPNLVINKASGTLSLVGTIRTTTSWTYTAGTIAPGASTVVFGGGTVTGSHTLNAVDFRANTTIAAGTTLTAGGLLSLSAGNLNTGTVAAQGDVSQALGYGGGTGTLLVDGGSNQAFTGASTTASGNLPLVVINKPSGTLSLAGTIRTASNWTYTAGTLAPGASTIVFAGGTVTGSHTLSAIDFRATTTIAAGTTLTAGGLLSLSGGSLNTGTVAAQADVSQALGYGGGTGTLLVNGGANQVVTGASTTGSGNLPALVINKASGTLTLAGTIRTANNWTYTAGTLDPGTSTVVFVGGTVTGNHTLNAVDFRATTTIAAGTTLTVGGQLTLTAGNLNTGTVSALADISQALGYGGGTGTLLVNGIGAQTLTGASTTASGNLPALVINKPSGTLTLAGTIRTLSNWTYTTGAVAPGTSTVVFAATLAISGSHSLADVVFNGGNSTYTLAVGTTLTVTGSLTLTDGNINTGTVSALGDVTQASTFDGNTGTLSLDGAGAQLFTGGSTATVGNVPNIVINKPSGTLTLAGTIRTSHNWTYTTGTLNPGSSTVVFAGGTVTGNHTLNAVDFRATTTIAAGTTLTVAGQLSLTAGSLNTGTVAALSDISQVLGYTGGSGTLLINGAGAQTLTGASTTASGNLPQVVINKPSGTLTLAGTIRTASNWTYTTGTLDPGTSNVVFAGGTVSGSHTLNAVDFRATTTIAAGTTLTVAGQLTLSAGNINTGTVAALTDISQALGYGGGTGTLLINGSGAQTLTGASTIASGNLPALVINKPSGTLSLVGTIRTTGAWTFSAGTVAPGTSTVVFAGSTVTSAGMAFYDVIGNGGTTTLGSAMTIGHDLTVSAGTFTTSAGNYGMSIARNLAIAGTLRLNGSAVSVAGDITLSGTFTAGTSTVTLNGSAGQSIAGPSAMTFFNLAAGDLAGVTMAANVTVSNVLTLSAGSFTVGQHTLTISNPLAGTITNLVADGTSSITVNGAAAGIVMPSSVAQLNNLTLNNASGLGLQANLSVLGTLTLTNGPVTTGPFTLRIAPGGTVTRTGGRVYGYLQKHVSAGAGTALTFEVGDATRYAPVAVVFATVTTAGELTASTTAGDHSLIASSGIAPTLSANRFWTITNAGVTFDTYDATFTFNAADLDAGANAALFIVAKLDGGSWTLPAVGIRTALSTQALAMTSFSDFQLGQPAAADLGLVASDGLASVTAGDGLSHGYTLTVTNSGPSDATTVNLSVTWPSGFAVGIVSPAQGSCSPVGAGPDFSCALGTIAAGGSVSVTAAFTVPASTPGGTQTLSAGVTSPVNDPDPTNNSATDDTVVIAVTPTPTPGPTATPTPGPTAAPTTTPSSAPTASHGSSNPGGQGLPSTSSTPPGALPVEDLTLIGLFCAIVFLISALLIGIARAGISANR